MRFPEWLANKMAEDKARNPRRSMRAFARKLEISPSTLSEILSGKRSITSKMARRIAEKLELDESQSKLLFEAALVSQMESLSLKYAQPPFEK